MRLNILADLAQDKSLKVWWDVSQVDLWVKGKDFWSLIEFAGHWWGGTELNKILAEQNY